MLGDRRLGLADADRLDQHDVAAGRLAEQHGLARLAGDAAEHQAARRGPNESVGIGAEADHPGLVAEQAAAGADARGIDRQHGDAMARGGEPAAQGFDQGALAGAGNPGDADPDRAPGVGQQPVQQLLRHLLVIGQVRLDEGDGTRQHRPIPAEYAVRIVREGQSRGALGRAGGRG